MSTDDSSGNLPESTVLAVERTRLASERTMMSWIRTAISLITLGFTIYKFFQYRQQMQGQPITEGFFSSRDFGMMMIASGVIALMIAIFGHERDMRRMRKRYGTVSVSFASVLASLIALLGLLGLAEILLQQ